MQKPKHVVIEQSWWLHKDIRAASCLQHEVRVNLTLSPRVKGIVPQLKWVQVRPVLRYSAQEYAEFKRV